MEMMVEIESRRARRAISGAAMADGTAERLLRAATLAPSCFNNQPWRLVAARSPEALAALRECLPEGNAWALPAPLVVAVLSKPSLDCRLDEGRDYALFDAGLCAMNLMLQATREGLVAHPIAGFAPKKVRAALGIPADYVVIALIVVGHPGDPGRLSGWQADSETAPRERKPFAETVSWDRFGFA